MNRLAFANIRHQVQQIDTRIHIYRICLKPDTRADAVFPRAAIDAWFYDEGIHASLSVIMAGLQKVRCFAGVHRRIIKIEFGHVKSEQYPIPAL